MATPARRDADVIPFARPRPAMPPDEATGSPRLGAPAPRAPAGSTWGSTRPSSRAPFTFGSAARVVPATAAAPVFASPVAPVAPVFASPVAPVFASPVAPVFASPAAPVFASPAAPVPASPVTPAWVPPAVARPAPAARPPAPVELAAPLAVPANDFAVENPTLDDANAPRLRRSRWAAFEQLGLVAAKVDPKQWSKHVVTAYRLLGFAILTIIVVVLIGYITTTAFYYWSNSWIVPTALAPTDEKVVSLQGQLAERQNQRDQTAMALDQAERAIAVQQAFQGEFAKAIQSDLDGRQAALERMHALAQAAAATRSQIKRSNNDYASESQRRMAEEWKAGLIDRNAMLSGKFQLAQISSSNLSLIERQAEYETRAADLEAQTRSLEALLAHAPTRGAMSYDVLRIKQEYEASRLETQKAIEMRDMLKIALARQNQLVGSLKQAAYLRAMADGAQVAYVPYGNLDRVKRGDGLYGCRLGMIFCHRVGTVLDVLPGEVLFKHPSRDKQLRGQMVELKLEDGAAATDDVLFVGGRPMWI